ncbi:MAG: outer membrane lipoprotein-sorting protein [Candidatus Thiodiazotropha sp. (ex Ctena orbiculata)]|nr:outer membrane lipoprotein-sorting protein [Candidatus Thiodiazotropha taylori]
MVQLSKTIWLLIFIATGSLADDSAKQAVELLQKSEALMRSSGTQAEYQIDILRPDWQRTMTFRSHDDRDNSRFRMEILSPRKTKGTVFLKVDNILSMYLPKLRRQINISPAMMQDPWMGSDFNNQDLLDTDAMIDGHSHQIIDRQGEGESGVYTIESIPEPDTTVTWKKLVRKIRGDGVPLEMAYHCRKKVKRLMVFDQIAEMGGRVIPTRWTMQPDDAEGKRTVITLTSIKFNVALESQLFTPMQAE